MPRVAGGSREPAARRERMATTRKTRPIPLLALFIAWLVPGAGHVYLGRTLRGLVIFVTISATFWAGLAVGGVMTVDSQNERWWFVAEMFTGIHGLVAWHQSKSFTDRLAADKGPVENLDEWNALLNAEGVYLPYPTDNVARAYAGVAGLLNLLCVFDAVILSIMGVTGEPGGARRKQPAEEGAP
ncbi:MAG TPA: hypothetical protein PK082_07195 [Phycisphaerae bacterium]|nr:hypothetical protein [Phycisphaerae bacterium]